MKYTKFYNSKSTTSSNSSVATATAGTGASNGSNDINVKQLATDQMQIATVNEADSIEAATYTFFTYNSDGTENNAHELVIEEGDTLEKVLSKVDKASDGNVRAFYDKNSGQVVFETKRTGVYNENDK